MNTKTAEEGRGGGEGLSSTSDTAGSGNGSDNNGTRNDNSNGKEEKEKGESGSSSSTTKTSSERKLVEKLVRNRVYNNGKFRRYRNVKLVRINELIRDVDPSFLETVTTTKFPHINEINASDDGLPVNEIEFLDFSLSLPEQQSEQTTSWNRVNTLLLPALRMIFLTIRELDMSYVRFDMSPVRPTVTEMYLNLFFSHLPFLRKLTWKGSDRNIYMHGKPISSQPNLTELYLDDSLLNVSSLNREYLTQMSDLDDDGDFFMFYKCEKLERLSIRNVQCNDSFESTTRIDIPQNALIKFVRNAPDTMKWFRSDLTQENIDLLQSERPNIELVN